MRFNAYVGLLSLALLCASGVARPDASTSWSPVVEQKIPLFHDLSTVHPGRIDNPGGVIELEEMKSMRGRIGDWLVKKRILYPQQKVTLRISGLHGGACMKDAPADVAWAFPEGHYLPPRIDANTDTINIIAWRSFPVEATVTCAGESAETYTTWAEVE